MRTVAKDLLIEKHQPRWTGTWVWLAFAAAFFGLAGILFALVWAGVAWWWTVPLMLVQAHLMHAHLIAFHETAHSTLCPNRRLNDMVGMLVGLLGFMSLTAYRTIHHSHHAYLATVRDEELWPFVDLAQPRWFRRFMAAVELTVGLLFTPFLFVRSFLRKGTPVQNPRIRRRIWAEMVLIIGFWAAVVGVTACLGAWTYLLFVYVCPAVLAGNMQSLRKYVEHMGLEGTGAITATRSVINPGLLGRLLSFSLFNEPFHGVHHIYARLPQDALPEFADLLYPEAPEEIHPFASYRHAFGDMARSLSDPKIGPAWLGSDSSTISE